MDCRLGTDARNVLRLGETGLGGDRGDVGLGTFEDVGAGGGGTLGPARAVPLPLGIGGGARYATVGLRVVASARG